MTFRLSNKMDNFAQRVSIHFLGSAVDLVMRSDRVAIIGGGIGGLAAAATLASHGLDVTLFEALSHLGGKIRRAAPEGGGADPEPSSSEPSAQALPSSRCAGCSMSCFAEAGSSLASRLDLSPLDILARHAWHGSGPLDLYADSARSEDAIGRFAGAAEARGFRRFCERAARVYGHLDETFMRQPEPRFDKLAFNLAFRPTALWDISPYTTLWSALGAFFSDPRLLQLFGRYATYCGSSPFAAPATLMLVAHVEQCGVWQIEGGMSALAQAVADLATEKGARLHTQAPVEEIITDSSGRHGAASCVRRDCRGRCRGLQQRRRRARRRRARACGTTPFAPPATDGPLSLGTDLGSDSPLGRLSAVPGTTSSSPTITRQSSTTS